MSNQDSQLQNYYYHVAPAKAGTQKSLHLPDFLLRGNNNSKVLQVAQDVIVFRPDTPSNLLLTAFLFCSVVVMLCAGCATVGQDFPDYRVGEIQLNQTTQNEIRSMFGSPWRVGIEDGERTWTYGRYRYQAFGPANTKDLVIRFDKRGMVTSYTFNTTEHQE